MLLVEKSANTKLGQMGATYRKVGDSCPSSCPLLNNGCYAQSGKTAMHQKRAEISEGDGAKFQAWVSTTKAKLIRLHVSGDFFSGDKPDKEYIDGVLKGFKARKDVVGYTYTHGWKKLSKRLNSLDNLTVNASTDNTQDRIKAVKAGWPVVMVVTDDEKRKSWMDEATGKKVVVCPNQTSGITCNQCMLCAKKHRPQIVAFKAHGALRKRVKVGE